MTNPATDPRPSPPQTGPPAEQLSLVARITALEDQQQRIYNMLARDREWMDELRARIGLSV